MNRFMYLLKSSAFWICLCSIVIINFVMLYIVVGNIFIYKRSFINLFLLPKVYTTNIIGFILPVIPFIFLFSKKIKLKISRIEDYLVNALSVAVMFILAFLFELLIYFIIDPSVKSLAFPAVGLFSSVLETNPLLYIVLFILHTSAWGFVLTVLGLTVFQRTRNQFYAVAITFLVSRLSVYIPIVYGNIKIHAFRYIIPQLPFEISQMENNWIMDLIQLLVVFTVSVCFIYENK